MESILIVQSRKARRHEPIELDLARFPNLKRTWYAASQLESVRIIRKHQPELVILDVRAAFGLDFQLFEETKEQPYQKIIICDSGDYALKVLRFHIDDYLVKPSSNHEISTAIERLLFREKRFGIQKLYSDRHLRNQVLLSTVFLPTTTGTHAVDLQEIVRVADLGEYRHVYMLNGKESMSTESLDQLAYVLANADFHRTSVSEIINTKHVIALRTQRERLWAEMMDGHRVLLPVALEDRLRDGLKVRKRQTPHTLHGVDPLLD